MNVRKFVDVKKEFEKEFNNPKITNNTLHVKYKSIIKKHVESEEVSDEQKKLFEDFGEEIIKSTESRPDVKNEIEEKLLNLQKDILRGYRSFETTKGKIVVKFPGVIDDEETELECSKLYNRLLQDDEMMTETEIIERLEKRGVWSKDKENLMNKTMEDFRDINIDLSSEKLKDYPDMKKILKLIDRSDKLEKQYDELSEQKGKHVQNSIETRVEELRLRNKLLRCVYKLKSEKTDEPGERYWNNLDQLKNEPKSFVFEVFRFANNYWNGVDPSFLDLAPSVEEPEGADAKEISKV
jgi:hypothetical protein